MQSNRPIAIDMDGVLSNFTKAFVQVVNSIWPGKFPLTYMPSNWDWSPDLTKEEFSAAWDRAMLIDDFWYSLEPLERNVNALKRFIAAHPTQEIVFLTSRPNTKHGYSAGTQTDAWLRKNVIGGYWPFGTIRVVQSAQEKADWLINDGVSHFIDDNGDTIISAPKSVKAFLLSYPYNNYVLKQLPRDRVVGSLGHFLKEVENDIY